MSFASNTQINMEELFEKKKQFDLDTLDTFNKILKRVHNKIIETSKQSIKNKYCWYMIPKFIFGISKRYDHNECVVYIIDKLKENGFNVMYTHPDLLFISWDHFVPKYVRNEIKKKTGIEIDKFGNEIKQNTEEIVMDYMKNSPKLEKKKTTFKSTNIYNDNLFEKLDNII